MYLSNRTRFRIGIGLITVPAFMLGLLLGAILILLLSAQPSWAQAYPENTQKTASATAKITLVLHEKKDSDEYQNPTSNKRPFFNTTPTVIVIENGIRVVEPV